MKYLATLLLLVSFNAQAFNGLDTELTQRTIEAADAKITIKSDPSKVDMLKVGHKIMAAREVIRNAVSVSTLASPRSMAHQIAINLYYKGIAVDTIKIVSRFSVDTYKVDLSSNINVEAVDLP